MVDAISVTFWGVRGSMPCTEARYQEFGGHTISLEVCIGGQILAIDMGSGVRRFGEKLHHAKHSARLPVLFSHLHLDHLLGLPSFAPLYNKDMQIDFYGANQFFGHGSLQESLQRFCAPPFFPIKFSDMPARITCHDFAPGAILYPFKDEIAVRTVAIPHPNGCVGYRFDYTGKSLALLCDMMPIRDDEEKILDAVAGVDALIIDAAYDDAQYAKREDWGHCNWSYVLELARKIGAPPVYIIHHDMLNDDVALRIMEGEAKACYDCVTFVHQGLTISV